MKDSDIPYKFGDVWAIANALVTSPIPDTAAGGNASQQQGFPAITAVLPGAGGIPPNISDFNGMLQYLSLWTRWSQSVAPVFYDSAFSAAIGGYPQGTKLFSADKTHYWQSDIDDNTSNPDSAGANWTHVTLLGGFASRRANIMTNTAITVSSRNQFINVSNGVTITLPAASTVTGMAVGFYALGVVAITSAGGSIVGDLISSTSVSMIVGEYLSIQSDGTSWRIFAASPKFLGYASIAFVNPGNSLALPAGYRKNSDGTIEQWINTTIVAAGGVPVGTVVFLPLSCPNGVLKIGICFAGNTPPGAGSPGSISVDYRDNSSVQAYANYTAPGTLAVHIDVLGW